MHILTRFRFRQSHTDVAFHCFHSFLSRSWVCSKTVFQMKIMGFVNVLVLFAKKDLDLTCWLSCFTVQRACDFAARNIGMILSLPVFSSPFDLHV